VGRLPDRHGGPDRVRWHPPPSSCSSAATSSRSTSFGITSGWPVYLAFYAIFLGIHLLGVGEALKVTFVSTAIAVVALLVFVVTMIPEFSTSNLTDIKPDTGKAGASEFLPFSAVGSFVNSVGFAGLVASFFSIIFAYSRQLFALSRSGYLPRALSVTTGRKVPSIALIVPAIIGFLLAAITEDGATMLNIAVFGATVSYVLMMLAHIVLRRREPDLERGYRTPGGTATSGVALVLATLAVVATFLVDVQAAIITLGVDGTAALYFLLYSRHHLVSSAPEEEFEAITSAEWELCGA